MNPAEVSTARRAFQDVPSGTTAAVSPAARYHPVQCRGP